MDNLGLPETIARALLLKLSWDVNQVENKFMDDIDILQTLFKVDLGKGEKLIKQTMNSEFYCPVCWESKPDKIGMECGHIFCKECYKGHLEAYMS